MSDSATIERPAERVGEFDSDQAQRALSGEDPFDEGTTIDDEAPRGLPSTHSPAIRLPSPSST
jgi:hypothetical protein